MDFHRQLDLINMARLSELEVTLLGAGSVGSWIAMVLAKMGVQHLTVYDPDKLESHNLPNQLYRLGAEGQFKTAALRAQLKDYAGLELQERRQTYVNQPLDGLVISAVDSMEARQAIWKQVSEVWLPALYIETRMAAEAGCIYTVLPRHTGQGEWYAKLLHTDADSLEERCTARTIVYNVAFMAALVGKQVQRYVNGLPLAPELIFDLSTEAPALASPRQSKMFTAT